MLETRTSTGKPTRKRASLKTAAGGSSTMRARDSPSSRRRSTSRKRKRSPGGTSSSRATTTPPGIINEVFDQAVQMITEGDIALSDSMKERGIRLLKTVTTVTYYFAFNMLDDVVGGYTPEKQKLRRAISIAVDMEEWIQIFDNGRGIPAQDILPPGIFGHRPGREGVNEYVYEWDEEEGRPERRSIEQAKQLLAEAGYPGGKDREGNPLVINFDTAWTGAWAKPQIDWLRKQFRKLDIDLQIRQTDYNRFRDKVKKGNFQILFWGWNADYPDPENFLFLLYGPNGKARHGGENAANYANPAFDAPFPTDGVHARTVRSV